MNERDVVSGSQRGINLRAVGMVVLLGCVYVGAAVVIVKVQRAASSPDFGKSAQMRVWRGVKGFADRNSVWWGDVGLRAGTMYNRCRNGI
jgi:hypothetical protein